MPILLTTPYTHPGAHGDPDDVYPMVQMTAFEVLPADRIARLTMQYGNVENGSWVSAGNVPPKIIVLRDVPEELGQGMNPATGQLEVGTVRAAVTDFSDMVAGLLIKAADDGVDYYTALGRDLFLWLIAQGYYEGQIV